MQSDLFKKFNLGRFKDSIRDDLLTLFDIDVDTSLKVTKFIAENDVCFSDRRYISIHADDFGLTPAQGTSIYRLAITFSSEASTHQIDEKVPQLWLSDLLEAEALVPGEEQQFLDFFNPFWIDFAANIKLQKLRSITKEGFLPYLESISYSVELRAVNSEPYDDLAIEEYEPNIVDTVGLATIYFSLDDSHFENVYFQTDEHGIKNLIGKLRAVLLDLKALKDIACKD